jgi:nucleoside-diphosphate-sugar epimerase
MSRALAGGAIAISISVMTTEAHLMKILVTGGKGAIGTRLVKKLTNMSHEACSYDIVDGQDLFDIPALETAVETIDVVYHAAAEANLNYMRTLDGARGGMSRNVSATDNVAYVCAKHHKWLLFISTTSVYGDVAEQPEREDATLPNPAEIYAASKYAAEWVIRGYGRSFDLPYTILRIATVYGPGCRPELGVHIFFRQALNGEPITVHGDGSQVRTLTYIDDSVEGMVAPLGHRNEALGQIFNIAGTEQISAVAMARQIKELTASRSEIVFVPQRQHNMKTEAADVSKAKRLLQWQAHTSFSEGLRPTLAWLASLQKA